MKKRFKVVIIYCLLLIIIISCSAQNSIEKVLPSLSDGKYDSEFPYRNSSEQLEEISNNIRLINSIAFYTSYVFAEESKITRGQLSNLDFKTKAIQEITFNRTASGTATIISNKNAAVVLLTAAHVVSFEDTIYSYFINKDGTPTNYIQSISVKTKQTTYIPDFPDNGEVDIILSDKTLDVALLGRQFLGNHATNLSPFKFAWGNSSELEWGTFIYVFGFPMNYKMISKGIVSNPNKDKNTFLIDAVFNRGSSGGIVLAIRDGVPNFELVGLVKSVPAEYQLNVHPLSTVNEIDFNPMIPYKGEIYVEREQVLRTGITKVIGIEAIKDFIIKNKEKILMQGYTIPNLFEDEKTKLINVH
ncbi:MAG: serine protease [Melioribacteraceae bacterium]|nr:serine protease [Melioribacteraceae bacterium]